MGRITKIICLLLALLMVQLPILGLPVSAAEEVEEIIEIKNPGFEETEGKFLKDWVHMDTEGAYFEVDTRRRIPATVPYISITLRQITPGSPKGELRV